MMKAASEESGAEPIETGLVDRTQVDTAGPFRVRGERDRHGHRGRRFPHQDLHRTVCGSNPDGASRREHLQVDRHRVLGVGRQAHEKEKQVPRERRGPWEALKP